MLTKLLVADSFWAGSKFLSEKDCKCNEWCREAQRK